MDDKKRAARYWLAFLILAVLLVILFVWNVNAGSIHLSVGEIMNIIFRHEGNATAYNIIWEIRLPRILAVIILGGALSVSGFLLQTFFNNPIAGPFVLGISSGAKLGVALLMIFFLSRSISMGSAAMIIAAYVPFKPWGFSQKAVQAEPIGFNASAVRLLSLWTAEYIL